MFVDLLALLLQYKHSGLNAGIPRAGRAVESREQFTHACVSNLMRMRIIQSRRRERFQ